jgi:hypothetical protein
MDALPRRPECVLSTAAVSRGPCTRRPDRQDVLSVLISQTPDSKARSSRVLPAGLSENAGATAEVNSFVQPGATER